MTSESITRTEQLLVALLSEIRGLRADLRRDGRLSALRAAIADEFGDGAFTAAGLLEVADTEPESPVTHALGELFDLRAPARSRATALGRLLAGVPWLSVQGDRRGVGLYVLADLPGPGPQAVS